MTQEGLFLSLVTPYRPIFEGSVKSVIIPLFDGLAGILKNHVDVIAELGPGKVVITTDEEKVVYFIDGGFLEVRKNKVTLLANEAYKKEELKKEQIQKEFQEVQKLKAHGSELIELKLQKLDALRKKLSFIQEN
ncbi:MAG: ATP synthase F1 subunit epsilon [Leptospiraceae bacterium]|nr:ATP synthase F1 subunit epsilon [Leptospiraceae bacterium]MDW7977042.1 ATP synthase F1 subunit epsilon [Leptospiraceae bacterium]